MSATVAGERVAGHLGGVHLAAEGRAFAVDVRYLAGSDVLPTVDELPRRVRRALEAAARDPGDVLVFLPGKNEIEACAQELRGEAVTVVPLHGGLTLEEQRRAFSKTPRRKVILATNVAETSLTVPGIGVVIDAGLVRQTRYHDGRGFLTLLPIAEDSAAQRAGRAGRTADGVCYRLWSAAARLEAMTPPEIHRESLVPLVLAAAAWGVRVEDLHLLDAPKAFALEAARQDLAAWEALAGDDALSEAGRDIFARPVDAAHARLLSLARREGCLDDMIDLVAALSSTRPIFASTAELSPADDLRSAGCDATALVAAVRAPRPGDHGLLAGPLSEVHAARDRLRHIEGLPAREPRPGPFAREAVMRAAIAADPRCVYVARPRGRDTFFSNGGTEVELARESAVTRLREVVALVVLDSRAFGAGKNQRVLITCGMALPLAAIAKAGLGRDQLGAVSLVGGRMVATVERVFAKRVIASREETPTGEVAVEGLVTLLTRGSLFKKAIATSRERLERTALAHRLAAMGHPAGLASETPVLELEAWLRARIAALGFTSGDDLPLLSADDFLAPELSFEVREPLDREFPTTVKAGDATYRAEYDVAQGQVVLHLTHGSRRDPPLAYLPRFPGLRICVAGAQGTLKVLRERGRG